MADKYIRGKTLGEGTWGQVFEATRKYDNRRVAIKRIKPMDPQLGVNFTALREVKHLKELDSPNIVKLLDVFFSSGVLHLVLEHCPHDLEKVIRDKTIILRTTHIKCYMNMILNGIDVCHSHFVLHRDLKPANLLIDSSGVLKLADFGLARAHGSPEQLTSEVVTRWYRAPELLFGAPLYAAGVDVWAVGCIFAEMLFRVPLFPGDSDVEQLGRIFNVLGTPTASNWPSVHLLPGYVEFEHRHPMNLLSLFRGGGSGGSSLPLELDLLLRMLTLNPLKRITASEALTHEYFRSAPAACQVSELQLPSGTASADNLACSDSATVNMNQVDSKRAKF